ncbi:Cadmium, cobalt and zinc/H(+)-K(+) antiporter [Vibrio mediterranei]|uniref:cation diffusion facilitator family transporter n=1 Tax=Vibrio mediterranei TaxID=689 RepID=UPI000781D6BC|nr:cation diffusion facilitator family transporter [Vibrio mediterranei]SBO09146.1 Cadmium, cobalt and zinc/H(+)-K(+) antiporter [Vibrio mediterranei]
MQHSPQYNRVFATGITLNVLYIIVEAGVGYWSHSLALLADAGHNLSDVFSLAIAWGSVLLAQKSVSNTRTFGWRKLTIFSAILSAVVLYLALGSVAWEALRRFSDQPEVSSSAIMAIAAVGVGVNGITAWMFAKSRQDDLNMKGMFVHMMADTGVSVGVIVSSLTIMMTGWHWVDSITSLCIVIVVLKETWSLTKQSCHLAVDGVPESIDMTLLAQSLLKVDGVTGFHRLHVWAVSTTETALTVHITTDRPPLYDDHLLVAIQRVLKPYSITESTIQIERSMNFCSSEQGKDSGLFSRPYIKPPIPLKESTNEHSYTNT